MRHTLNQSTITILGGFLLFTILVVLISMDHVFIGNVATSRTTVNIVNVSEYNCTVAVGTGINTVSFPCIIGTRNANSLFNDTNMVAAYQYVPTTSSDLWRVYNPNLPGWVVNDLTTVTRRPGYVVVMDAPSSFFHEGALASLTNIPIISGWQLVGYPANRTRTVASGFSGVLDSFTEARTYNNTLGVYLSYANGTLTHILSTQGYWINGNASDTWQVFP